MTYNKIIMIPIGGIGKRFKDSSYTKPKALINLFGQPIIYWLLNNLKITNELVFIVYNNEYSKYRFEDMLKKDFPKINFLFYCLKENTRGAAETINIGLNNLPLEEDMPILCLDSDNFYTEDILSKCVYGNQVFYFKSNIEEPIFSYIKINNQNEISNIIEKEKISNNACTGAYSFKSWFQLKKFTEEIIKNNIRFKNEFYTSSCIKYMIDSNIKFMGTEVSYENYHCIGTPLQLKLFYNNFPIKTCNNLQLNIKPKRFCFDLDNTLVTFPKINNDYTSVEPIQTNINIVNYLKKMGHIIIIHTARRMKTHKSNLGALMADIGKITFDTLDKFNINYDEIYFGKPNADFYIDDKSIIAYDNLEKELGFYLDNIEPRDFNNLNSNMIEIFKKESNDLSGEIYYYNNIPRNIKDMFPLLIDFDINNKWYKIEKINGLTLSNYYLSELLTETTLLSVLNSIKRLQHSSIINNTEINIYNNYLPKLIKRYEEYDYSYLEKSDTIFEELKKKLNEYEKKNLGKVSVIHGDPVFTNIIINNMNKIKFIDMRGRSGKLTIYGDYLYDWAKIYQSLIGYDEILLEKTININYKNKIIKIFLNFFENNFGKDKLCYLKTITKSLLFTLIPLHNNNKCIKYYELIFSDYLM